MNLFKHNKWNLSPPPPNSNLKSLPHLYPPPPNGRGRIGEGPTYILPLPLGGGGLRRGREF